jgi:hypothetical protein
MKKFGIPVGQVITSQYVRAIECQAYECAKLAQQEKRKRSQP